MKKIPPESIIRAAAPIVTVSPTVSQLLKRAAKRKRIRHSDLARALAAISAHLEHGGAVPAHFQPVEIFNLIGATLVSGSEWAKLHNTARAEVARNEQAQWQRQADEIWHRRPDLSNSAVAKQIAPGRWKHVRRKITKPKK